MSYYLCVDGGTTNTRVCLCRSHELLDTVRLPLGARAGIDGTAPLKEALKEAIAALLARFSLQESNVVRILASGMITSEFGLCSLSHIPAPAGVTLICGSPAGSSCCMAECPLVSCRSRFLSYSSAAALSTLLESVGRSGAVDNYVLVNVDVHEELVEALAIVLGPWRSTSPRRLMPTS